MTWVGDRLQLETWAARTSPPPVRELVDLAGGEVVGEDVEREEVLEREYGEVLPDDFAHSGVVDGEDCDRHSPVDLPGQMRLREVVVERGVFRVLGQDLGDVEAIRNTDRARKEDKEDEDRPHSAFSEEGRSKSGRT